jgi:hypothetical protein
VGLYLISYLPNGNNLITCNFYNQSASIGNNLITCNFYNQSASIGNNLITCNFYNQSASNARPVNGGNAHTWITCCKNQLHHLYLIDVIDRWWQKALEKKKSCERIWQWVQACKETMDTLEILCKTDHKKHAKTTKGGWCPKAKRFVVVTVDGYGNMEEEEEEGPGNIWTFPGPKKLQKGL